jgi:hypothetical protein
MIKCSKSTLLIKNEFKNGLIKKTIDPTGQFAEYYVYTGLNSGTINSRTGNYEEGSIVEQKKELKCVIVAENDPSRIIKNKKKDKFILVKGYIFNDIEYPDLTDYLGRTERHL